MRDGLPRIRVRELVEGRVEFSNADLALAWDASFRTAEHELVRAVSPEVVQELEQLYKTRLARAIADGDSLRYAAVLYAFGTS